MTRDPEAAPSSTVPAAKPTATVIDWPAASPVVSARTVAPPSGSRVEVIRQGVSSAP